MSALSGFSWIARLPCSHAWSPAARRALEIGQHTKGFAMSNEYLIIERVYKSFGTGFAATEVLHDVSLRVQKGQFIAVIGHSGCGKSTLLNIVAGLTPATQGYV